MDLHYEDRQCVIVDAKYENVPQGNGYLDVVNILVRDIKTGQLIALPLLEDQIRELCNLKESLTNMELIQFATNLRNRTSPFTLRVPKNTTTNIITGDTLLEIDKESNNLPAKTNTKTQNPNFSRKRVKQ
jgi:hypothetical protein